MMSTDIDLSNRVASPLKGKLYRVVTKNPYNHFILFSRPDACDTTNNILEDVYNHSIVMFLEICKEDSLWNQVVFKDLVGWIYNPNFLELTEDE